MTLTIRPMQADDYPALQSIFQQGIDSGNATFQTVAPAWEVWDHSKLEDCRLIIQQKTKIIGWAALSGSSGHDFFYGLAEVSIYIAESAQGKGAGSQLMQALIECSEQQGYWTLTAGIFPENEASLKLHQKNGFRIIGTRERPAQMKDGRWRDVVLLERRSQIVGTQDR
jgi:phosphinothricin acetyltransferase